MENKNSYKIVIKNTPISSNSSNSPNNKKIKLIIITICIIIFICLIIFLVLCIVHYYKTDCFTKKTFFEYLFDFSNSDVCIVETEPMPEVIPPPLPPPQLPEQPLINLFQKKEVFHIANQDYTYDQSKCKCESYGGRLATKNEVTDAYNNGANWCTYGWTDNQSAYYPVQKCDWDTIQKDNERLPDKNKKYCGMPGLNGGYFANTQIKFGVNCYGVKPKGNIVKPKAPYCPPMNFCKLESNFEASNVLDTDEIVGFNNNQWDMNMK